MIDSLIHTDSKLFLLLNGLHSPFWDTMMWHISGKAEWIPLYVFIFGWFVYRFRLKSIPLIVAVIVLIGLSDQLSVILFKNTVQRFRPCHNPDIMQFVHLVKNHCGGKYGFISSHAANSFALATFTSTVFKNKYYTILIFFWALLVSYSRIYLGVHYPGDVLAGALFGILLAFLVKSVYSAIIKKFAQQNREAA